MSLLDDIKKAIGLEEEKVEAPAMMPPPEKPVLKRNPNESDLDYSLRKRKAMFEWKKAMEDYEMNPEKYQMTESEGADGEDSLRGVVEGAYSRSERELENMGQ